MEIINLGACGTCSQGGREGAGEANFPRASSSQGGLITLNASRPGRGFMV